MKPAPLDPSIARHIEPFIANLREDGPCHGAAAFAWGANRKMSGPEVRQLLAHVRAAGLVERRTNKVRALMADGLSRSIGVMAELTGLPRTVANATVTRLADKDVLERVERGVYRLKAAS